MTGYEQDRQWSDLMIPQIKAIVGRHLLEVASYEVDVKQATDLMVFSARDMRVAARVRRPGYADKYPHEFTIRAARSSGAETELSKIVNGWGDALFYGHADANNRIVLWHLICLDAFRAALIRHSLNGQKVKWANHSNGDGTFFKAFDLKSFPEFPPILIASSNPPLPRMNEECALVAAE
jgi:hypothetical protein